MVPLQGLECDPTCSERFDDAFTTPWFRHVLPQLREQTWFGKKVAEVVQQPGERERERETKGTGRVARSWEV